jgi:hypothetical protein
LHFLDGHVKIGDFIGVEICESWDLAIRDDKHVTWEKGLDIDQAIRVWGIVEYLAPWIRLGDMVRVSRECLPGL